MFCQNCGSVIPENAQNCVHCGHQLQPAADPVSRALVPREGKSWVVTLLLALVLPLTGIHRFYTGHIGIGLIQLVTAGGCGIWYIIDVILIVLDGYEDADGRQLVK